MTPETVVVTTIVPVDAATAFGIFTDEIAAWWKPRVNLFRPGGTGTMKFENGKLLEFYPDAEPFEVGRVLVWDPGTRLAFEWRQADFAPGEITEVDVRFEPAPGGTRVTLEHRGWDEFPASHPARHNYTGNAFTGMIGLRWADLLTAYRAATAPLRRSTAP